MVSKGVIVGIVAVVAVVGLAAAFMMQAPSPTQTVAPSPAPAAGVTRIEITLEEERGGRKWVPSTVTVKVGADVELTVENEDDETAHQLVIPDLNVDTGKIEPGKKVTVHFKADKAGRFQFHDPIPDEMVGDEDVKHSQEKGILVVEP